MSGQSNSDKDWPGGWLVAVVAGVVAAILARWIGDVGMTAAVLVGVVVFLVFGVILGMFWSVPASGGHDGHGHDDHEHGDAGHHDHGHSSPAAAAVLAPVTDVTPVAPVAEPVAAVEPAPVVAAEPVEPAPVMAAGPVEAEPVTADAVRPAGLSGPRGGQGDDLQTLEGIGPVMEKLCHELGFYHFDQIASWGAAEVAWMDANLKGFKGRVTRDKWVRQARLIGEVGLDEFKRRAKTNDY